jgi:NDP-sugar pyrophosphorylase family protein
MPDMRAIVLAAGFGTRLGAIGRERPKVLIEVAGRPLLAWQLDYLYEQGVQRVTVTAHHLHEKIATFIAGYQAPIAADVTVESELRGTAGSVRDAFARTPGGPLIVLYGDVVIRVSLSRLLQQHVAREGLATITLHEVHDTTAKGVVEVGVDGFVTRFREKDPRMHGPGLVNSGLYVVEPELFTGVPEGQPLDFGHDVFPRVLARGGRLNAQIVESPVVDVGTPHGLDAADQLLSHSYRRIG